MSELCSPALAGAGALVLRVEIAEALLDSRLLCVRLDPGGGPLAWRAAAMLEQVRAARPDEPLLEDLACEVGALCELRRRSASAAARRAEELLRERYAGRISLRDLAQEIRVHPVQLARSFRQSYSESVCGRARALRVEQAFCELARTDRAVAEIARDAGFADQAHLTRTMRRLTTMTPARARRMARRA